MNSNEDKVYIKIVASNAIYNFVVEKFLNENHLGCRKLFFVSIYNLKFKI